MRVDHPRVLTQPSTVFIPQKMHRIHGSVCVQTPKHLNKKTTIIQVQPNNKILFHCYKRFKSFPYQFDRVFEDGQENQSHFVNLQSKNLRQAIHGGFNYMMYCTGVLTEKNMKQIGEIQMMFYEAIEIIFKEVNQNILSKLKVNIFLVNDETILDLVSQKPIQLWESQNMQEYFFSSDSSQVQIQTLYQLFQLIKKTSESKQRINPHSYLGIYLQVHKEGNRNNFLFVNATKKKKDFNSNWDSGAVLTLNKCILGLLSRKQQQQKRTFIPFRDSKITKIMKSYLSSNSKVDIIGFIDADNQQSPYFTLNLVKNLSRLKIAVKNLHLKTDNPEQKKLNLDAKKNQNVHLENQTKHSISDRLRQRKIIEKTDLFEQVRTKARQQVELSKKLYEVRAQIKIMKKKKQLQKVGLSSLEKSLHLQNLESEQVQIKNKKEQRILEDFEIINQNRIETIQKSVSKVQKLKLLKQYYTTALIQQKQEAEQFLQQQKHLAKFYQQNMNNIDKILKKSPKKIIEFFDSQGIRSSKSSKSEQKQQKPLFRRKNQKLPLVNNSIQKHLTLIKKKVKLGRVQYTQFLTKNVQQYQSYSAPKNH